MKTATQHIHTAGETAGELATRFVVVNLDELIRVEKRLVQLEQREKWSAHKADIFFTNKKGVLDSRTAGAFLEKGLPHLEKGLNSILKDNDHVSRLARLLKLEALYEICKGGVHWNDVTAEQLAERQAFIQKFKESYQPC